MSWDTREISQIIESNEIYYNALKKTIGNELMFMLYIYVIIEHWNESHNDKLIDSSNVNGNEVYISYCEATGNETEGWK